MTVRSTEGRETLLKLALPAPQGSCEAAGRLPGASEAQDPRLAFLNIARAGGESCSSLFSEKISFEDAQERALQRSVL